jgi:hypothetical protein
MNGKTHTHTIFFTKRLIQQTLFFLSSFFPHSAIYDKQQRRKKYKQKKYVYCCAILTFETHDMIHKSKRILISKLNKRQLYIARNILRNIIILHTHTF